MPIYKTKNENFFKKWSPEMAYILGFFCADGNLTLGKRGNHYIEFTSCDQDILEKIRAALSSNHKITGKKRERNHKMYFRIQIGSKEMFRDLTKFGLRPNKSKCLAFPSIPDEHFNDFVRGYFDGDGHVTFGLYKKTGRRKKTKLIFSGFTSGTESFLKKLHRKLLRFGVVNGGTLYYQKGYRLNFSIKDSLAMYNFLYNKPINDLYLSRKKRVFEKYINAAVV